MKGQDLVGLSKTSKDEILYVAVQPPEAIVTHVVCIYKNRIVDGTFYHQLKCDAESLRWLCGDANYTFHGYILQMSQGLKKTMEKK